ncbi:hypothetical protein JAAARDRAFT_27813 [Jaapia argillacea MUCL 33604]|uniref:Uncharacterized protein n=1 Tax=Jaapia argillacea MUCL 33604 TaxID=933084 RepID=A0A067QAV0_9AGAM|nr:hypothetical protein JAAARDRAFT_27813 [Jaapia argillacea MUCL 33604]
MTPATANIIPFPTRPSTQASDAMSVVSRHATALEVCDMVYGEGEPASLETIERFYEANAGYENPFITATSRSVITDIHSLSRQMSKVDVSKPIAMLYTLLGLRREPGSDTWFRALRVWTEVGELSESESFDGHRRCMVEHTLNVLFLPGLHSDGHFSHAGRFFPNPATPTQGTPAAELSIYTPHESASHPLDPAIPVPFLNFLLPSPLHLQLHVITRLSFNESGRVTHHRDFWDLKDVVGLVPGGTLAQWIGARVAATGLSIVSRMLGFSKTTVNAVASERRKGSDREDDLESGRGDLSPAALYARSAMRFVRSSVSSSNTPTRHSSAHDLPSLRYHTSLPHHGTPSAYR